MTDHILTLIAIIVPAVVAIIAALIKTRPRTLKKAPASEIDHLTEEVKILKTDLERQHIKIDDISERLAWLEGRESKK